MRFFLGVSQGVLHLPGALVFVTLYWYISNFENEDEGDNILLTLQPEYENYVSINNLNTCDFQQ